MEKINSGIYAIFGTERKDVITEATAQEFRDWMKGKGFDIDFMSDASLSGEFFGFDRKPFLQWQMRCAFIKDAEVMGVVVYRVKDQWNAFMNKFREETERLYG